MLRNFTKFVPEKLLGAPFSGFLLPKLDVPDCEADPKVGVEPSPPKDDVTGADSDPDTDPPAGEPNTLDPDPDPNPVLEPNSPAPRFLEGTEAGDPKVEAD